MAYTTINKGSLYMNTVLYAGNGGTQSITGVSFQPDFVWYKDRTNASSHGLFDSVRGADKFLSSNLTIAEITQSGVSSFDSDGFSLGSDSGGNGSGNTFASWNWLGGGSPSSNTDGDITSSVSASTTSGFSIVKYTGNGSDGATVGHGLGAVPKLIIYKELTEARNWYVFTSVIDGTYDNLYLNLTDAKVDRSITLPTSSLFSLSTSNEHNASGQDYIAYCFADVKGFSKFGSYDGNAGVGALVDNFQYCGFKPSFVLIKSYNASENWTIFDNRRNGFNPDNDMLFPNTNSTEGDANNTGIDLLSNGFNPYYGTGNINRSGKSYIYMAFAEHPLVGSDGTPVTAR